MANLRLEASSLGRARNSRLIVSASNGSNFLRTLLLYRILYISRTDEERYPGRGSFVASRRNLGGASVSKTSSHVLAGPGRGLDLLVAGNVWRWYAKRVDRALAPRPRLGTAYRRSSPPQYAIPPLRWPDLFVLRHVRRRTVMVAQKIRREVLQQTLREVILQVPISMRLTRN